MDALSTGTSTELAELTRKAMGEAVKKSCANGSKPNFKKATFPFSGISCHFHDSDCSEELIPDVYDALIREYKKGGWVVMRLRGATGKDKRHRPILIMKDVSISKRPDERRHGNVAIEVHVNSISSSITVNLWRATECTSSI